MDPMPISIGKVYYSFLNKEFLGQEQVSRRDSDLECYDRITEAIAKLPEAEKCKAFFYFYIMSSYVKPFRQISGIPPQ